MEVEEGEAEFLKPIWVYLDPVKSLHVTRGTYTQV